MAAAAMTVALVAELLYREPPTVDMTAVLAHVRRTLPDTVLGDGEGALLVHAGFGAHTEWLPLSTALTRSPPGSRQVTTAPHDFSQTWGWAHAVQAVEVATAAVAVAEVIGHPQSAQDRVLAFGAVVGALLETTEPAATWWPGATKFVAPEDAVDVRAGLVNVRMFRGEDGDETVMDSLGLHVLGLPDLQCIHTDLDPQAVAGTLYATATYLLEQGDVIADDDTIPGPDGSWWRCRRAAALVAPQRPVLAVSPLG